MVYTDSVIYFEDNDDLRKEFKSPFLCVQFAVVAYEHPEGYVWDGTETYCVEADIYDSTMVRSGVVSKKDTISLKFDFEVRLFNNRPDEHDLLDTTAREMMEKNVRNNEECNLKYGTMELPLMFCSYTYGRNDLRRGLWRV